MVEVAVAALLLGVVSAVAFGSGARQRQHAVHAMAETRALRLVTAALEEVRATSQALHEGTQDLQLVPARTVGLLECRGVRVVREIEPGLFSVRAQVSWRVRGAKHWRDVALTTWVER